MSLIKFSPYDNHMIKSILPARTGKLHGLIDMPCIKWLNCLGEAAQEGHLTL